MKRRRQSDAPLPPPVLEFAAPLRVRAAGLEAGAVLDEVPARHALDLFKALRLVLAWARGPDLAGAVLSREEVREWEAELLAGRQDEPLWAPLVTLASELKRPERTDPGVLAQACFVVSEWALGAGAQETALLFAEAAALAWPENARYAWLVGRMLRNHGRLREGELWLKRAARVAVWCQDWETQDLALNSLGNLYAQQGSFVEALHCLTRALNLARRQNMKQREGAVTHDLFMIAVFTGEHAKAEKLALSTIELYGPDHPGLPKLAHDVAYFWNEQGRFELALPVLLALLPFFRIAEERLLVLAATARAAGACGKHEIYERARIELWEILNSATTPPANTAHPAAMLHLGLGAAGLGNWLDAAEALTRALESARAQGVHDDAARAEAALEMVRRHERIEHVRRTHVSGVAARMSIAFVRLLKEARSKLLDQMEQVHGRTT